MLATGLELQKQRDFELAASKRHYDLLASYNPEILQEIEKSIEAGVDPTTIRVWAKRVFMGEDQIIQRCYFAAMYCQKQLEERYGQK